MKLSNVGSIAALMLVLAVPPAVATPSEPQAGKLEGTWRVQVTVRDCQSGSALRTFPALLTFARGGTLTETTSAFPPSLRTSGHGFWQHSGDHTYVAVSEAFLFGSTGVWTGLQRITQDIQIGSDPDRLSSTATTLILDTAGNTLATICATAVATKAK